jgi:hypothetical protein
MITEQRLRGFGSGFGVAERGSGRRVLGTSGTDARTGRGALRPYDAFRFWAVRRMTTVAAPAAATRPGVRWVVVDSRIVGCTSLAIVIWATLASHSRVRRRHRAPCTRVEVRRALSMPDLY